MNIYISGISGTGMGPLAIMAKNAGLSVTGSDKSEGQIFQELQNNKINFQIGNQDGSYLEEQHNRQKIDWFVYTSALPSDHPELLLARKLGIKTSKRDEFISYLVSSLHLKMVAVAGTHGKTTTTSMLIWAAQKLGIKASYLVGTTLNFAPSGSYHEGDQYFIYEADEYDRNFLHFKPWLSLITYVSYDHPDIYPTKEDYQKAFNDFELQSDNIIFAGPQATPQDISFLNDKNPEVILSIDSRIRLSGEARRKDATTALHAIRQIMSDSSQYTNNSDAKIIEILNDFPGVGRRFEKLADGIYTDYAHHPEEIKATIEIAKEEAEITGKRGVIAIYEPHQNVRQHQVKDGYKDAFLGCKQLYWLPTYLVREDPNLVVYTPQDFINDLSNSEIGVPAAMDNQLKENILAAKNDGYLVLLMTAGPADNWLRQLVDDSINN